eukprot:PRCOL_00005523-RA
MSLSGASAADRAATASKGDDLIDDLINRLIGAGGNRTQRSVPLSEDEVRTVCAKAKAIFLEQPCMLELSAPVKICGDIHGQFSDLLRLFEYGGYPPNTSYLFLGDYVDRGRNGVEVTMLLLCYKIKYPDCFHMLRGNHESASISRIYGFYDEVKRRFNIKTWKMFMDVFNCLPFAAVVDERIFCIHGGLSPELKNLEQIQNIPRPTDIPDNGMLCDFLWADPDPDILGWGENDRGVSYVFGKQFDNAGAMMSVDETLMCSFQILKPADKGRGVAQRPGTPQTRRGAFSGFP